MRQRAFVKEKTFLSPFLAAEQQAKKKVILKLFFFSGAKSQSEQEQQTKKNVYLEPEVLLPDTLCGPVSISIYIYPDGKCAYPPCQPTPWINTIFGGSTSDNNNDELHTASEPGRVIETSAKQHAFL